MAAALSHQAAPNARADADHADGELPSLAHAVVIKVFVEVDGATHLL